MTDMDRARRHGQALAEWHAQGRAKALAEVLAEMTRFEDQESRWDYLRRRVEHMADEIEQNRTTPEPDGRDHG